MKASSTAMALAPYAFVLVLFACQSTPTTSSSSNWFVCEMPADCESVIDAVDCADGYCVDHAGARIERSGSGGTASGGTASGSGGESSNLGGRGSTAGSGGTSASAGGTTSDLNCDDFDVLAACEQDEDCTTDLRMVDCCGTIAVLGVSSGQIDEFAALSDECATGYPACGCAGPLYPRAEDGRLLVSGEAEVSCVEGQCQSSVGERPCGDELTCVAGELCAVHTTVTGPNQTMEFSCVDNPCAGVALDCTCATSACELGDGRSRVCTAPPTGDADIVCQDQAQ